MREPSLLESSLNQPALDAENFLNQSALKMINLDYNSDYNSDDDVLSVIEEEIISHGATDSEADLEDGEVKEEAKVPPPPPSTEITNRDQTHRHRIVKMA